MMHKEREIITLEDTPMSDDFGSNFVTIVDDDGDEALTTFKYDEDDTKIANEPINPTSFSAIISPEGGEPKCPT